MNADFLAVLEFWEREKGISRDVLIGAVNDAMLSAAKKAVGPARELRCEIDPKSGDIKAFAMLVVSEKVISKHDQISVFDARRIKPDAQVGEEVEVEVTPTGFGRIASQNAKQALMQAIRKAGKPLLEQAVVVDRYSGEQVASGSCSQAFRLRYRDPKRTLTDAEVDQAHQTIRAALEKQFGAELRA